MTLQNSRILTMPTNGNLSMKTLDEVLQSVGMTADFYFSEIQNVNYENALGDTPLHVVSRRGEADAAKILLEAGAAVNALGEEGQTPIFGAIDSHSVETVKTLLNYGADLSIVDKMVGATPLQYANACSNEPGMREIINLLEAANASKPE
jgi:ankyrin repeat protein